jgi:hypothetical protein
VGGRENDWLYEEEPEAEDSGPQLWAGIVNELNAMQEPGSGATYGQKYDAQGALDSYAQARMRHRTYLASPWMTCHTNLMIPYPAS